MGELDDRKLQAEIANLDAQTIKARADSAKADAERARLGDSWRDWFLEAIKVFSALALGAGGIAAAVTGYQLSEVKKERTELQISQEQTKLEELKRQKADTDAAVDAARKQLVDVQTELVGLQASLEEAQRSRSSGAGLQAAITRAASIQSAVNATSAQLHAAEQRQSAAPKISDLLVGLQTLGATDAERQELNQKISAAGYGLHELSASYQTRPSWFAPTSTVLYYSNASQSAAQGLAGKLHELTGQTFAVQRGSGLGVDPSQQGITLFVHYVKKP